jgi:hypothetical protein
MQSFALLGVVLFMVPSFRDQATSAVPPETHMAIVPPSVSATIEAKTSPAKARSKAVRRGEEAVYCLVM